MEATLNAGNVNSVISKSACLKTLMGTFWSTTTAMCCMHALWLRVLPLIQWKKITQARE